MDRDMAERLVALLARERRIFHYFRDRYALMMLRYRIGAGARIADLKASRAAALLGKPVIRPLVAACGGGRIGPDDLWEPWQAQDAATYVLGFDLWGSDDRRTWRRMQTSRRGINLVMRLNFDRAHDAVYRRRVDPAGRQYFAFSAHPVDFDPAGRNTLSWARIDIDPESATALIEEVQSDWVRDAACAWREARGLVADKRPDANLRMMGFDKRVKAADMCAYWEEALAPHVPVWAEATLAAAVALLIDVIGVQVIYMHTAGDGCLAKRMDPKWSAPPRSLYEDLPRKFSFERTNDYPPFIRRDATKAFRRRLKIGKAEFWRFAPQT